MTPTSAAMVRRSRLLGACRSRRSAPAAVAGPRSSRSRAGWKAAGGDIVGDAGAEHHRLEQGVGGEPVGAMRAGRGHLAAGPQPVDGAPPLRVGEDAAHVVMRRRRDRDRLARRIDAGGAASGVYGREMLGELGRRAARQSRKAPRPLATSR